MTPYTFPVEAGHILTFARAVGDLNPVYADPAYAAGSEPGTIIAPPTFTQACIRYDKDWEFRPKPGETWLGSGRTPSGVIEEGGSLDSGTTNILHAEQHFTYHQPIRPGMVLTVSQHDGDTWEKEGRRGGTLRFNEVILEYRDEAGDLVVTARAVQVVTTAVVQG